MEDPLKVYHDILSISNEEGGNPNHDPEDGRFTSGVNYESSLQKRGLSGDNMLNQLDKLDIFKNSVAN